MPPRHYLEKAAEIIYSAAELVPDGRINLKGISDWVEKNENMMSMFLMFQPTDKVEEKIKLFLPLPRPKDQLNVLSEKYLGKRIRKEEDEAPPTPNIFTKLKGSVTKEDSFKIPAISARELEPDKILKLNSTKVPNTSRRNLKIETLDKFTTINDKEFSKISQFSTKGIEGLGNESINSN